MKLKYLLPALLLFGACSKNEKHGKVILNNDVLSDCNTAIQNAIVVDHVSAPAGSRRYFYATVAAYESLVPFYSEYTSLAGQLHELKALPACDTSKDYCLDLVALAAHTYASEKLVYKMDSIKFYRERKLNWYKSRISESQYKNSIAWGDSVGQHIVKWASSDTFNQIRGRDFYSPSGVEGRWEPTSPDFQSAVEPNWNRVRPACIPKAGAFKIAPPEPFSKSKSSRFYTITKEVYDVVARKDSAELLTALYWDDNPNTMVHKGHVTFNLLKVSPAGHWLGMYSTISRQKKYSLIQSAEGFARFSAVIFDAFIACWDAKYKYDYIRPETAIRMLIDSSWSSPIQTPAFPEYPSGHSVVSTSVGTLSDSYFGNYSFTDSAEMEFGLGTRKFNGILEASKEACMSRLYGGIHFIDGIKNGQDLGRQIGQYHLEHIKTKK
ncbi:MAG: vanadium-dependent haloperoxidase [Bacteroidia bacterium]|nr:vanadium-dependent haloperoxidase [Bacteroidia bacterium]